MSRVSIKKLKKQQSLPPKLMDSFELKIGVSHSYIMTSFEAVPEKVA